jgi:predicted SnoaL-like aldol condensation-catalyzing enzyme
MFKHFAPTVAALCVLGVTIANAGTPQEERNKANAIAFYEAFFNKKNWDEAKLYVGSYWLEHNPQAPRDQGLAGLEGYAKAVGKLHPEHRSIIIRAAAQGDLVVLQVHNIEHPGFMRGNSMMQFLRFENGKIVESWPVFQVIPGVENTNGMF